MNLTQAQLATLTPEQIAAYQAATASGEIPTVSVAGLKVPAPLVPRIVASMRGVYPSVTGTLDDDAAVRAVLKFWVTSTLANWESQQWTAPTEEQVAAIQAEATAKAQQASKKAEEDAASIIEAAPPAPDDPAL